MRCSSCAASKMILISLKNVNGCLRMSSVVAIVNSSWSPRSRMAPGVRGWADQRADWKAGMNLRLSICSAPPQAIVSAGPSKITFCFRAPWRGISLVRHVTISVTASVLAPSSFLVLLRRSLAGGSQQIQRDVHTSVGSLELQVVRGRIRTFVERTNEIPSPSNELSPQIRFSFCKNLLPGDQQILRGDP